MEVRPISRKMPRPLNPELGWSYRHWTVDRGIHVPPAVASRPAGLGRAGPGLAISPRADLDVKVFRINRNDIH